MKSTKDYRALAAYICADNCPVSVYGDDYRLWKAKVDYAVDILFEAGVDAVDAILYELEKGEYKALVAASMLVKIGDARAVPLLKRLNDRGEWRNYADEITKFVNKYPQYHMDVEKVPCAICGDVRPVTEMKRCWKRCGGDYFCGDVCWSKRGRVIEHGIGSNCPYYAEGVCMAGGRDTGLCSLCEGSYRTSCHVYAMYPNPPVMPSSMPESQTDRECGDCSWFAHAYLDGDPNKGICNHGSGQKRPFTISPGDQVRIAHPKDRACEHYKGFGFD
ncbi:MAG: hypothetical protein ABSF37_05440 [Sedimentisphaerales bacterium]